jgi:hypothetical protein
MATTPAGADTQAKITVELTPDEAVAVSTALFMCLRPNNVHPPFAPLANVDAMEQGYRKIASPISELEGRSCARCGRAWEASVGPWDSIGDPETGELELICDECATPEEKAAWDEHHQRFEQYAMRLYSTPSWKSGPGGAARP